MPSSGPLAFLLAPTSQATLASFGVNASNFADLALHVQRLAYGRTAVTDDVFQVLRDGCGTCSSKHRLLALVAREAGRPDLRLTVGIYLMSEANTPGVGQVLASQGLSAIPEAHCYLSCHGHRFDFTGLNAGLASPFDSLQAEFFVEPEVLTAEKDALHKQAIAQWSPSVGLSPQSAWAIREECIAALQLHSVQRTRLQG